MDLITPNRLRLGRNNERSPVGHLSVINDMNKTIKENENIFNAWFEIWLSCHVPKLMEQQKWYKSGLDLKEGDIVLFVKQEPSNVLTINLAWSNLFKLGEMGKLVR